MKRDLLKYLSVQSYGKISAAILS